jgi:hypothetical protein
VIYELVQRYLCENSWTKWELKSDFNPILGLEKGFAALRYEHSG